MSTAAIRVPQTLDPTRHPDDLKRVSLQLPSMSLGWILTAICVVTDVAGWIVRGSDQYGYLGIGLMVSYIARIYWIFCVFRIHRVLAQATSSSYPIGPWQAVLFQFIPIFGLVWNFKWSARIVGFVNDRLPSTPRKRRWPGLCLLLATLVGYGQIFIKSTSPRLLLMFGVGFYLTRMIRGVIEYEAVFHVPRKKQLDIAMSAGLCAGFGFLLYQATVEFSRNGWQKQRREIVGIVLLSLALAKFIEPLTERLRIAFGADVHHHSEQVQKSWLLQVAVFLVLLFSSFCHDLLNEKITGDFIEAGKILVCGLLVSGGITYFWIAGAHKKPARAARFGVCSGALISLTLVLVFAGATESGSSMDGNGPAALRPIEAASGIMPLGLMPNLTSGKSIYTYTIPWALLGLVGGLIIDRNLGKRGVQSVAVGIVGIALLAGAGALIVLLMSKYEIKAETVILVGANLSAVIGWCAGLLLHPSASKTLVRHEVALQKV